MHLSCFSWLERKLGLHYGRDDGTGVDQAEAGRVRRA